MIYKLSPSNLTYLYEGCKYCFSLKVKHGISQPSMPLPGIFTTIANLQDRFYADKRIENLCPKLPPGIVEYGEQWVESTPIKIGTEGNSCYIRGRFDAVVKFDDGTYGVIDFKTAKPSDTKTMMYGRQLQSYTYALEHAAQGKFSLSPISMLGILYLTPSKFKQVNESQQAITGDLTWHEVKRNDNGFIDFLTNVVNILDSNTVHPHVCSRCEYCQKGNKCPAGKLEAQEKGCTCCTWCTYREKMRDIDKDPGLPLKDIEAEKTPLCPTCDSSMNKRTGKYGDFWSCQKYPDCRGTRDAKKISLQ